MNATLELPEPTDVDLFKAYLNILLKELLVENTVSSQSGGKGDSNIFFDISSSSFINIFMAIPYNYHYSGRIEKCIIQFMRIFSGFQVQYGVDRNNDMENDFKKVSVHYGSPDRVVANVLTENSTFTTHPLPIITGFITGFDLNPEARRSRKHQENIMFIDESTEEKKIIQKLMGVPYIANVDLTVWATNPQQMFQILEQIMLIFNPKITFQVNEDIHDWSYISSAELVGLANEENYPTGVEDQIIIQTLNFTFDFWLNYPRKDLDTIIETIELNVKDNTNQVVILDQVVIDENTPT